MATPTRNVRWGFVTVNSATALTTGTTAPTIGDWIVAAVTLPVGQTPVFSDSVNGSTGWTVYGPFGPTGGTRNYYIWLGIFGPCASATTRTITVTPTSATQMSLGATSFSGCAATNAVDRFAVATGSGTALNSGASAVTRAANEIVCGYGSVDTSTSGTWTAGSSGGAYLNDGTAGSGASGTGPNLGIESRGDSAANAKTADFSFTITGPWVMALVTLSDTPISAGGAGSNGAMMMQGVGS